MISSNVLPTAFALNSSSSATMTFNLVIPLERRS